jgi:hypothetical protein
MTHEEWLRSLGRRFVDRTEEAVQKGLAFVILGGRATKTSPVGDDDPGRDLGEG